jgi:hypothetical protein
MVALLAWSHAIAWVVSAERPLLSPAFERFGFIKVGHDNIVVDPTIRRYTGMVAALGTPAGDGKVYSFTTAPVGPRSFALSPNDLRGWRLTVLSGNAFGHVFRVSGNTESVITVTNDQGGLDGLQVRDVFIIESIDANGMSMFAPPGTAQPVPPGL